MKLRLLPLLALAIAALPAQAQLRHSTSIVHSQGHAALQPVASSELPWVDKAKPTTSIALTQAKTAAAAFYTQTFASMPTGWTTAANPGSVNAWRWANAAPVGTGNNYPINGLINSTTKSNGWLLYNADSVINQSGVTKPFGGSVTSAAIPVGASHTNVMLSFQQYFRHSDSDYCFVDVSSNGTTWTTFPIEPNNKLSQFGFLYHNATTTTLNISSVVGGQANAYIRFRFSSNAATYSFNWLIDDLMLYDADATDLGITYSGIASVSDSNVSFSNSYSYSSIPLRLTDSVYPITYVSNYGLALVSGSVLTARYFRNGSLVSTQTANLPAVPLGARDSALAFNTGFKATATGDYVVALSLNASGDGTAQNDVDTIRFSVSDSVYASHGSNFTERNCYLTRPSSSGAASYWGARFTISNGKPDTITSVTAAFRPMTPAGTRIQAQLYEASGSGVTYSWVPVAVSYTKTLTAADISTASGVVTTDFPMRVTGGNLSSLTLGNGDYAIVLTTVNSTSDVAVYSMEPPLPTAPSFIGYQGQSDTSLNDGSIFFAGTGGIATGLVQVPFVHPNFGNARALLAVPETDRIVLGAAYPNPSNSSFNIPVALTQSGSAQITLSNPVGQVLSRTDLGRIQAGVMQLATVATGQLPEGVYFYTVEADGSRASGRILVRH